ncbi:MAG: signal peptidase I [Candidatus Nealsonbacteria bacterium CG09_land_8_20_14_0_10_42_14]|uniref:Signal peptidase I n=1 Tax=Candidatus Nealsonbacteria bacterium CG09_land_8_20_14_0_10_42_14 TaxID=1974707 RepID=A0A2H0WXV7_9BACT|nr:MAG: signal peptidase I [Candidatus Nealsonbacteria bacterium CG09_land_8_20_14_0_10_42_14]
MNLLIHRCMKHFFLFVWEVAKIVIIAMLIVVPIRYFVFQPFFVKGQSMEPNFQHGDYLIVDELSYQFRTPQRGEVIVFKSPQDPSQRYIKRIVGLPGETIEIQDGRVTIFQADGTTQFLDESYYLPDSLLTLGKVQVTLDRDEYFVMGDNRLLSFDSRSWGALDEGNIIGRVFFRAWPFAALAKVELPTY